VVVSWELSQETTTSPGQRPPDQQVSARVPDSEAGVPPGEPPAAGPGARGSALHRAGSPRVSPPPGREPGEPPAAGPGARGSALRRLDIHHLGAERAGIEGEGPVLGNVDLHRAAW